MSRSGIVVKENDGEEEEEGVFEEVLEEESEEV